MPDRSLTAIAAGFALAGGAKLAGAQFTRDNFKRWGYPTGARTVVGTVEVGLAVAAVGAMKDPEARPVVALGTICTMVGALATHVRAGDPPQEALPAVGLLVAGLAVLRGSR